MTKFWLVRHGETDWNKEGRFQGQADPPLNNKGRAQAQQIAIQLVEKDINAIYSSDLIRAKHTAQIISDVIMIPVNEDKRLREVSLGNWEGMLVDDIIANFPQEWQMRQQDPLNAAPPGGESLAQLARRIWEVADEIEFLYPEGSVIVVSHGLALASLLCREQNIPLSQAYQIVPENAFPIPITTNELH